MTEWDDFKRTLAKAFGIDKAVGWLTRRLPARIEMHPLNWQAITDEQKDGDDWIVGYDIATAWIVRSAWWSDGSLYDHHGYDTPEEDRGWWSYKNGNTQEKLEGFETPTHFLCRANRPPYQSMQTPCRGRPNND